MNRTLKLALGAVLGLGMITPAFAQNFPDIPDNHWAYDALANLKGKVLFGYPDGLYRPARPMSRAEFAVAINQLYQMMMAKSASMDSAMDAMSKRIDGIKPGTGGGSQADIDAMKKQMADMQSKMAGMASMQSDMASMKRLAGEFEKELAEMGVNMDAMKKDMADLAKRVTDMEGMKGSVKISGDGNWVLIAGHSTDGENGLTPAGRITGYLNGDAVGMNRDFNVYHEFNVTMSGNAGDGVAWKASMNMNDMLDGSGESSFGDLSDQRWAPFEMDEGAMYFDELTAKFDTSIGGQGFSAEVGRFRHSGGAFFLQREDRTEFYKNSRWDDGKFMMDGAKFDFGFGGADLTVFFARNSHFEAIGGDETELNPMIHDGSPFDSSDFQVDATLGAELSFKLGENGNLKAVHYWMDAFNEADFGDGDFNRMNVSGLEANFNVGAIELWGAYAKTDFMLNNDSVTTDNNTATAVWAGYKKSNWGLGGFWAVVEGNFGAFGDWGRLGTEWRPANIDGYGASLWFQPSEKMKISFNGEWFEGNGNQGFFGLPLGTDDKVTSYTIKLNYDLNEAWDLMLSYENVDWEFAGVGGTPLPLSDPEQRWWTIGLSRNLSDHATFSLMYMASDVDFKSSTGDGNPLDDQWGNNVYKGGVLSSQLTFKF